MDIEDLKNAHKAAERLERLRQFHRQRNQYTPQPTVTLYFGREKSAFPLTDKEVDYFLAHIENDLLTTLKAYGITE